ncbi:MAG: thioredoxin family protein [Muricauda sp.]|jgi:peroxiredoxin|nr:thioredoxin family protein [Allomuricauda sp.]MBO6532878.1 thioredoxin family protein [Allomuricauda sp.]MBO6589363.1 thioredoxin family protein [Allomuricauda sp.]MBO6619205.1 thioredoxin family protein [Allomuricauda sp.]MBO6644900.1 thioredoxin family protein [Allomuricauda sp.]MBO6747325.1 thioredoxin family protein [Allomuricauda sp.]
MKRARILGWSALLVVFVAAFATGFKVANEHSLDKGYQVGDMATDFSLKNVDGSMVSLSDFEEAKGFIVIFTCNTCPYAQAYEDRIMDLDAKYKSQGVPVIAINPNDPSAKPGDSFAKMKERAAEKGFTFPYLFDEGQKVYPAYGATRTPHVFILEKTASGNEVKYIGAIDDNYQDASQVDEKFVENAVDAMLAGNEINPKTTKAIGCGIK